MLLFQSQGPRFQSRVVFYFTAPTDFNATGCASQSVHLRLPLFLSLFLALSPSLSCSHSLPLPIPDRNSTKLNPAPFPPPRLLPFTPLHPHHAVFVSIFVLFFQTCSYLHSWDFPPDKRIHFHPLSPSYMFSQPLTLSHFLFLPSLLYTHIHSSSAEAGFLILSEVHPLTGTVYCVLCHKCVMGN